MKKTEIAEDSVRVGPWPRGDGTALKQPARIGVRPGDDGQHAEAGIGPHPPSRVGAPPAVEASPRQGRPSQGEPGRRLGTPTAARRPRAIAGGQPMPTEAKRENVAELREQLSRNR